MVPFLTALSSLFGPVSKVIDDLHTSEEEKSILRTSMLGLQVSFGGKLLEYEKSRMEMQAAVIKAEASSGSAITRMWRPITMLTFLGMVVSYWFGMTPEGITQPTVDNVFDLIKLGLGGYVIGRSAEKVVPQVAEIFKRNT